MPDGIDTSIYKTQPNPLGTIANVYGVLNAAQQNQLLQQTQDIRNYELRNSQANELRTTLGTLANQPGVTRAQVLGTAAQWAKQRQPMPGVLEEAIAPFQNPTADIAGTLKSYGIQAAGVPGLTARTEMVSPTTGARSAPPSTSLIGQGILTAPPVGFEEVAKGPAGAAGINDMLAIRDQAPQQKALLENLSDLSSEAVTGPSADWEKRANALVQRLFPGSKLTLTPEQLAKSEEYGKISEQLAGQQATAAHSTNAFLTNAYNTNPSLYLSKIGRQGITHMLQGNVDSIVAKANAWTEAGLAPAQFSKWNSQFNKEFNPRVFQYARMTPEERAGFRSAMPKEQQGKFAKQIQDYQSKGWIDLGG